jgi:hypothetical protein
MNSREKREDINLASEGFLMKQIDIGLTYDRSILVIAHLVL